MKDIKKAFFFLRHNNDIDLIAPVIYKWLKVENIPTDVILLDKKEFLNDDRIKFLSKLNKANIYHINDLSNGKINLISIFNFLYLSKRFDFIPGRIWKTKGYLKTKLDGERRFFTKIVKRISNKLYKGIDDAIVVFDWINTDFVLTMIDIAKYNQFDCKVLWEILCYLRKNHS